LIVLEIPEKRTEPKQVAQKENPDMKPGFLVLRLRFIAGWGAMTRA
jgi:hypothetical protein